MNNAKLLVPTKLKYLLMVCFCLMTIIPMLAGAYLMNLVMKAAEEKGQGYLFTVSIVGLLSLLVAFLGFLVIKQLLMPLVQVKIAAQNIASGKLEENPQISTSTDEIQDLTESLKKISRNARELLDKVDRLSVKDKLTGLYNASYIRERLNEEIQRAIHYQRPCSFAFVVIKNHDEILARMGSEAAETALKNMANVLSEQMTEFDRAARIGLAEFAIIFPDKNKKKCIDAIEKIGAKAPAGLSLCVGISENPIDGVQADDLYVKAQDRMKTAFGAGKLLEAFV